MPAPWKRLVMVPTTVGQIQAVQAKKHVTVFQRKPSAPGAGRPEVKAAFTECANRTLGTPNRNDRIAMVKDCMLSKGLKTGVIHRKSRAKPGSPLYGTVYTLGGGAAGRGRRGRGAAAE
jgi:hypothetical protein